MKIPLAIHQTWKDENIPEAVAAYARTWKAHHPGWEYTLWTDAMNKDFISTHYPEFLPVYSRYHTAIQRVDAVRYFILHHMGGVFIDLDFECLKNVGPLLKDATFVAGLEPQVHADAHRKRYIISNAFMASIPGSVFIEQVCKTLLQNDYYKYYREPGFNAILDCAGPFMLSRIYASFEPKDGLNILEPSLLYPLAKDMQTDRIHPEDLIRESVIGNAYAIHHYWGSWWH